jgi:hypothetical protein
MIGYTVTGVMVVHDEARLPTQREKSILNFQCRRNHRLDVLQVGSDYTIELIIPSTRTSFQGRCTKLSINLKVSHIIISSQHVARKR